MVSYNKMKGWCMTGCAVMVLLLETALINYHLTKPTQPISIQSWDKYVEKQKKLGREI